MRQRLLVDLVLEAQARAPQQIILDRDATDDSLHGQQDARPTRLLQQLVLKDAGATDPDSLERALETFRLVAAKLAK